MHTMLRLFAAAGLLVSAQAFADRAPDCDAMVWSSAHGHYHCVEDRRYTEARYYAPAPVAAPRVYVNLGYNRYPGAWRVHRGHWGWYAPRYYGRVVYFAPRHVHGPYCRHRGW